jgi:hypothetical protein
MGWIESPSYFCSATETCRDVAIEYTETPVRALNDHKFIMHTQGSDAYQSLPKHKPSLHTLFRYLMEVYVDNYIGLVIPTTRGQLHHVANGVMCAIHDVFPPDARDKNNQISLKKLLSWDGEWDKIKELLGFIFNGNDKTIRLAQGKCDALISTIKEWLRASGKTKRFGIPFTEFRSVIYKVRFAFTAIPAGKGLMSPFYSILSKEPNVVFLQQNRGLR